MYFIRKGRVQVLLNGAVVHSFDDSGYFGEIALMTDEPRSADVGSLLDRKRAP